MRTSVMLLAVTALLAACSTAEERAAYRVDPASAMEPQYGAGCEKVGYAKGSDQWRTCILRSSMHNDLAQWGYYWERQPQRDAWDRTH